MYFFHNSSFCYLPFVLYSFILLAFTLLNPEDFLLPQAHFCSSLTLSIYLHSLPFDLIGFVTIDDLCDFPLALPSHPKVFFHDFFNKQTLLLLLFCEHFLEKYFTTAIDIYCNFNQQLLMAEQGTCHHCFVYFSFHSTS